MRPATQEEEAAVRASLEAVERGLYERFLSGKRLCILAGGEVVLADPALLRLPAALLEGATGGLRVGQLGDGFALHLQGSVIFARETRNQTVTVIEKSARLFLYGRNILAGSILAFDPHLNPGDHCVVTNPRHEALGIGRVVGRFKGSGEAVHPVHDLGSYLRDQ